MSRYGPIGFEVRECIMPAMLDQQCSGYRLELLDKHYAQAQQVNIQWLTQRQQAYSSVSRLLARSSSPGFQRPLRLADYMRGAPKALQPRIKQWARELPVEQRGTYHEHYWRNAYLLPDWQLQRPLRAVYSQPIARYVGMTQEKQLELRRLELFQDVVAIMQYVKYLHHNGYIYGALTPDHVTRSKCGQIRLACYDQVVSVVSDNEVNWSIENEFVPPEILLNLDKNTFTPMQDHHIYKRGLDIWMLGMLVYYMASRGKSNIFGLPEEYWQQTDDRAGLLREHLRCCSQITMDQLQFDDPIFQGRDGKYLQGFIRLCLTRDPNKRRLITIDYLYKQLPYFYLKKTALDELKKVADVNKDLAILPVDDDLPAHYGVALSPVAVQRYQKVRAEGRSQNEALLQARPTMRRVWRSMSRKKKIALVCAAILLLGSAVAVVLVGVGIDLYRRSYRAKKSMKKDYAKFQSVKISAMPAVVKEEKQPLLADCNRLSMDAGPILNRCSNSLRMLGVTRESKLVCKPRKDSDTVTKEWIERPY